MLPSFYRAQGSFARPTSTGDYTVTGIVDVDDNVSFTPKIILLRGCQLAADGDQADSRLIMGSVSALDETQHCMSETLVDGATYYTSAIMSASECYTSYVNAGGSYNLEASATYVSVADGQFTINFNTVDANAPLIFWTVLGGDAITLATCGTFTPQSTTGQQVVTVGFPPDLLIGYMTGASTGGSYQNIQISNSYASSDSNGGIATGSSLATASDGSVLPTNNRRQLRQSVFVHQLAYNSDIINKAATYTGPTGTGFKLSHTTVNSETATYCYLAIAGLTGRIGQTLAPNSGTAPIDVSATGFPFKPKILFIEGAVRQTGPGVAAGMRNLHGIAISPTNQYVMFQGSTDNVNPPVNREDLSSTKLIRDLEETSTGVTLRAQASLKSFNSDGFTLTWDTRYSTLFAHNFLAVAAKPIYKAAIFANKTGRYGLTEYTWNFNDGAQNWTPDSYWNSTVGIDGTGGNYAQAFSSGKGATASITMTWTGTFEDLGVPAGSVVQWISTSYFDGTTTGAYAYGSGSQYARIDSFRLLDEYSSLIQEILPQTNVTGSYKKYGQTDEPTTDLNLPSNTIIILEWRQSSRVGSGGLGTARCYMDNITVNVKHHYDS